MTAMEKNNKTLNVPNLRFPEFSGEWEKYSLGEVGSTIIGLTYSPSDVVKDGGTIVLRSSNIQDGEIDYKDLIFVNKKIKDTLYTRPNDLLVCARNGSARLIGKNALIAETDSGHTFGAFMMIYRSEDNQFIHQLLSTKRYYTQVGENLGARINQITTSDMNSFEFYFPKSKSEKDKIAHLLGLINLRISTQKKIIEDLKKLKDAICNLNFTSGSVLKLGNAGKFVRGLTYSASDVIDYTIGTAVMRSNNISNGDPVNFEELVWVNKTPNHEQILRSGDIVICMANGSSPLVGKASYYVDCGIESATVGAFCGIYRSDNPLTKWLFQSKHYKKHIQRCIQGGNGAIANIYPEDILAISFNIPCGYERVLNILNSLEEKYLLEQKLLSRYLGVKSYLLSRLFI